MIEKVISFAVCLAAGLACFWLYGKHCSKEKNDLVICAGMSFLIAVFVLMVLS